MFRVSSILAIAAPLLIACSSASTNRRETVVTTDKTEAPRDAARETPLRKPKLIIFDVNETLLDLAGLRTSVGRALDGREDLLPLWFSTMLHYSLVETVTGEHHSFGEIGTAALEMVANTRGIEISRDEARDAIVTPLRSLPPHADVKDALQELARDGYLIVSLTNSSAQGVQTQFESAGLTDLFSKRYTVDSVRRFKPHPDPYRMVLDDLGVDAADALMVAAHAWDLAGAGKVGMQTAFIKRPGAALYPLAPRPDLVLNDLTELVAQLRR